MAALTRRAQRREDAEDASSLLKSAPVRQQQVGSVYNPPATSSHVQLGCMRPCLARLDGMDGCEYCTVVRTKDRYIGGVFASFSPMCNNNWRQRAGWQFPVDGTRFGFSIGKSVTYTFPR